jgi:hypothetical protein
MYFENNAMECRSAVDVLLNRNKEMKTIIDYREE